MTENLCEFIHGTHCRFGYSDHLDELYTEQKIPQDQIDAKIHEFRIRNCTLCMEGMKLQELKDIKQELSWIREEMAVSNDR